VSDRLTAALADRYTIERELGAGGMATVYLAHDIRHNRKVALKVLKPELAAVVGASRFLREVEVTANLQHPHILPLFESGEADGLMHDVADALAYAHARGVVHRDIKPDNVMVSGRHAVVMDFGVARAVSEAADQQALTTVGMAVGTPVYMAPEQALADPAIDHRADIYALGVMGYELLTGAPPFSGRAPQQVLAAHISEAPEPLAKKRPEVGRGLADVVMRCLAKQPDDRWRTADEVAHRLEALATPHGGTSAVRAVTSKPTSWAIAVVGTVAIVAAVAIGIMRENSEPAATVSSSALAVFPFTVRGGPDVQYLGEGMVNLLAASMDGAGDLRSVDPRAVMAQVRQEELGEIAPAQAARMARGFGAGLFILGDIVQVGDRLRIDAALYGLQGESEPAGTATVDGEPDSILGMVDRVASQLLASGAAGSASRVTQLAVVTTSSLTALKLYLEGEGGVPGGS
jgi:serine/threonine-protein kinase